MSSTPLNVVVLRKREDLLKYHEQLTDLVSNALEPNVFYEPWMLFPALESNFIKGSLYLVMVFVTAEAGTGETGKLCGFFPLEKRWIFRGLPIPKLSLLRHPYCFLATPLVHRAYSQQTCLAFLNWAASGHGFFPVLELAELAADGPVHTLLDTIITNDTKIRYTESRYARSVFYPKNDAEQYLNTCISAKSRKALRRKKKRLSELGTITLDELAHEHDLDTWISEFIELEASGWKGTHGTAFKSDPGHQEYFKSVARHAFKLNRLHMLALRLNGRPIAMQCDLLTMDGCFGFKMAFDETYRRFSPGVLLGIEHIHVMHRSDFLWMDSCASPGQIMLNKLWPDRKLMRTILLSTSPFPGYILVGLIHLLKKLKKRVLSGLNNQILEVYSRHAVQKNQS